MSKYFVGLLILLSGCTCTKSYTSPVKSIGGCSSEGKCGVQYEDGSFGHEYRPVIGQPGVRFDCK